jgi:hypothetical protein
MEFTVIQRHQIKKELIDILRQADCSQISTLLQGYHERDLLNPLFSALCHQEEMVRWHAVSAFGWIVDKIAESNLESARVVMRRLLWSLNDESGGIGWGAPEAMAEIMIQNEALFQEYMHMLLSYMREDGPDPLQKGNYLELPQLQRGVVWGVGRLAGKYGKILAGNGVIDDLLPYLHSPDASVRGISTWSLGILKARSAREPIQQLLDDQGYVSLYQQGEIVETTVSELARQALDGIG